MLTPIPDGFIAGNTVAPQDTLVLAGCDPAAGWLASQFAATTGLRLLVLPRSSRQSLEMLKNGLVHIAGMHFSTKDDPERNTNIARETLGPGYTMVRIARWQEGITLSPSKRLRSVGAVKRARLSWIGREPGSGARQCLDQLLDNRPAPRRIARHHRGVVEAVASGWADAGVCVQLVSAEANLDFLPVQEEAYDVCFPTTLADDRRVKAFLNVVRSTTYRKLLGSLPGYHTGETGYVWYVD
jgi:putative molybdopterin biosynthesis protein